MSVVSVVETMSAAESSSLTQLSVVTDGQQRLECMYGNVRSVRVTTWSSREATFCAVTVPSATLEALVLVERVRLGWSVAATGVVGLPVLGDAPWWDTLLLGSLVDLALRDSARTAFAQLRHKRRVLRVELRLLVGCQVGVATTSAVARHMARTTTQSADDVGGVDALLRALPTTMALLTTVLAKLVLVVSEGTVKRGEFSELITLVVVLAFGCRRGGLDDLVNKSDTVPYLPIEFSSYEAVELVVLVAGKLLRTPFAVFDRPFASDTNLGATLTFHLLQRVTTGATQETKEVDLGELLDRNIHLLGGFAVTNTSHTAKLGWRSEVRVVLHGSVDETHPLCLELLAVPKFKSVGAATIGVVLRWWRGRALAGRRDNIPGTQFTVDLLEADVDGVVVKLLLRDLPGDGDRQGGIGLSFCVTPSGSAFARFWGVSRDVGAKGSCQLTLRCWFSALLFDALSTVIIPSSLGFPSPFLVPPILVTSTFITATFINAIPLALARRLGLVITSIPLASTIEELWPFVSAVSLVTTVEELHI